MLALSKEDVVEAAKAIGVHMKFIMSLPGGYAYNVQERGVMLSAGQRQLIAFLRAYMAKPTILVLDEATSSVDTFSEEIDPKGNRPNYQRQNIHRYCAPIGDHKKADRIIVMDQGEIVESGTHEELLNKENGGAYQKLHQLQFSQQAVV